MAPVLPHATSTQTSTSLLSTIRKSRLSHTIHRSKAFSAVLLVLALLALGAHLLTSFTIPKLSSELAHTIAAGTPSRLQSCNVKVGSSMCCALFNEAEPCVDQCRMEFMDRETTEVTIGFGDCEARCLKKYHEEGCGVDMRVKVRETIRDGGDSGEDMVER